MTPSALLWRALLFQENFKHVVHMQFTCLQQQQLPVCFAMQFPDVPQQIFLVVSVFARSRQQFTLAWSIFDTKTI